MSEMMPSCANLSIEIENILPLSKHVLEPGGGVEAFSRLQNGNVSVASKQLNKVN